MARGYPDYEGDKQKVYLTPEWAALEAVDKTFIMSATVSGDSWDTLDSYLVPAGKTLYITSFAVASDKYGIHGAVRSNDGLGNIVPLGIAGGYVGGQISYPKPLVITGGLTMETRVFNAHSANAVCHTCVQGYEL